eukprot:TRINITY_DN9941_c1_g1_i1.p1 TRINITY_DN9941_c1_g1~~TRINITY_DN9941_c1_g1_i1.p1  ORF type:complete len:279 (-),score=75.79 TRINITY_DN9941_c1_g1_i1:24-764(-)
MRERMLVCSMLPPHYEIARSMLRDMIDRPQIELCDNWRREHTKELLAYMPSIKEDGSLEMKEHFMMFGGFCGEFEERRKEYSGKVRRFRHSEEYKKVIEKISEGLNEKVLERSKIWLEDFKGLRWRTQNPGTQHTASINPIIEDPRKFYINCYSSFKIGIPNDVEHCVRLIFYVRLKFPKEIVNFIIRTLVERTFMSCPTYKYSGQPIRLVGYAIQDSSDDDPPDLLTRSAKYKRKAEEDLLTIIT